MTDEADLWARAREGDASSFAALFDTHRNRVFRHAVYHLGVREDAEDATATAFLELWRRRGRVVVVDGSILPWLLVTTTNVARNVNRARRRYSEFLGRLPHQVAGEDEAETLLENRLDAQRRLNEAAPAFAGLSATDRALLMLTVVEELPVSAAAAALGLSDGTARTRLYRAKRRLREGIEAFVSEGQS